MKIEFDESSLYFKVERDDAELIMAINRPITLTGITKLAYGSKVVELNPRYNKRLGIVNFPKGTYLLALTRNKRGKYTIKRLDVAAQSQIKGKMTELNDAIAHLINGLAQMMNEWKAANADDLKKIRTATEEAYVVNRGAIFTIIATLSRFAFTGQLAQYLMSLDKEEDEQEQ